MIHKIQGEQPFQVLASNFSIGPSNEGYTLQISSDGKNYSDLFSVGANVTRLVTLVANGSFYRLSGNASEVAINWREQCSDGGSGGGTGPQGPQGPQGPAGSGEGGDFTILNSVSALPMNQTWVEYEDETFYKVREDIVNDGEYMLHFNGTFTSVDCANGAITGSSRNMTYNSTDGKWHHDTYNDLVAWDDNGKLYWDCPYIITMFDAYDTGSDKEGLSETAAANESSVAALQGQQGVYQVVNNQWEHVGIQGPQGPAGGGEGGDSTILNPVSELPEDYTYGTWEEWADNTYTIVRETTNAGDFLIHWDSDNYYTGCHVSSDGEIDYSGYGMQQGADGRWYYSGNNNSVTAYTEGGKIYFICTAIISMFDAYGTGAGDKEGNTSAVYGPSDAAGSVRATSGGTYQVKDGEWKQLGGYDIDGALCIWNPETGYTAEWLSPLTSLETDEGDGLIYAEIPENQVLFEVKYSSNDATSAIYANNVLSFVDTGGTVISAITLGSDFEFTPTGTAVRKIFGTFQKHYIGIRKNYSLITFQNVWDGSVSGGHYELVDKTNYGYVEETNGVPKWNNKGQIIGKARDVSGTDFYVNTSASTSLVGTTLLMTGTNHMPTRFFVPTSGGNEGQVLTSAGANAAPVWATMIKALQITSADYEALVQAGTTDSNTLYLIVD